MVHRAASILLALLGAAGCASTDVGSLTIDVRSDLVAGVEFDRVVVAVLGQEGSLDARLGQSFIESVRVATFDDVPFGRVEGVLRFEGREETISRPFSLVLSQAVQVLTLVVTRDCRGIECPGTGSPTATACVAGECNESECISPAETPELCDTPPECDAASDCELADPCSVPTCADGQCAYADGGACPGGMYCHPERGCEALPMVSGCAASSVHVLQHGLAIGRVGEFSAMFTSLPGATIVSQRQMLDGVTLDVAAGGSVSVDASRAGEWPVDVEVVLDGGIPATSCARIVALGEEVKSFVGPTWADASAFEPPGVPTARDAVFVEADAMIPVDAEQPDELYVSLGVLLETAAPVTSRRVLSAGLSIIGLGEATRVELAGTFERVTSTSGAITLVAPTSVTVLAYDEVDIFGSDHLTLGSMSHEGEGNLALHGAPSLRLLGVVDDATFEARASGGAITTLGPIVRFEFADGFPPREHLTTITASGPVRVGVGRMDDVDLPSASTLVHFDSRLEVTGTMNVNRPVELTAGVSLDVNDLVLGPLFETTTPEGITVASCAPAEGAPPDICARHGW